MGNKVYQLKVNGHTYVGGLVGGDDDPIFPGDTSPRPWLFSKTNMNDGHYVMLDPTKGTEVSLSTKLTGAPEGKDLKDLGGFEM
ncbi:hypothetical protein RQP46_000119 [Phenoliferia psychrophenolica]